MAVIHTVSQAFIVDDTYDKVMELLAGEEWSIEVKKTSQKSTR